MVTQRDKAPVARLGDETGPGRYDRNVRDCTGTSRITVRWTPLSRRLKFGALTSGCRARGCVNGGIQIESGDPSGCYRIQPGRSLRGEKRDAAAVTSRALGMVKEDRTRGGQVFASATIRAAPWFQAAHRSLQKRDMVLPEGTAAPDWRHSTGCARQIGQRERPEKPRQTGWYATDPFTRVWPE